MNIRKNARLTPLRREEVALSVIEGARSKAKAARAYGVSAKILARWVERYKAEGRAGPAWHTGRRGRRAVPRPYTPRTNGKAERFIQTALREWAYAVAYPTSKHQAAELPVWLHRYNCHQTAS